MLYNYQFAGLFIFFAIALAALFNGMTALKTHAWAGFGRDYQGRSAVVAGWTLIGVAALACLGFLAMLQFGFGG